MGVTFIAKACIKISVWYIWNGRRWEHCVFHSPSDWVQLRAGGGPLPPTRMREYGNFFANFKWRLFPPSQLPRVFALLSLLPAEGLSLLSLAKWLCLSDNFSAYAMWCQIMQLFVTHERTTKCCVCISPSEGVQFWAKGFCCPLLCGAWKVFCQFQLSPPPILPLNFAHVGIDSLSLFLKVSLSLALCLFQGSASMPCAKW